MKEARSNVWKWTACWVFPKTEGNKNNEADSNVGFV